jgi:hypothetical protein
VTVRAPAAATAAAAAATEVPWILHFEQGPTPSVEVATEEQQLKDLRGMGFGVRQSRAALRHHGGNLQAAVDTLLKPVSVGGGEKRRRGAASHVTGGDSDFEDDDEQRQRRRRRRKPAPAAATAAPKPRRSKPAAAASTSAAAAAASMAQSVSRPAAHVPARAAD